MTHVTGKIALRMGAGALCLVALAGCGARTALEPAPGNSAPPPPFGTMQSPDPDQLLEPEALAAPERSVELRRRCRAHLDARKELPHGSRVSPALAPCPDTHDHKGRLLRSRELRKK